MRLRLGSVNLALVSIYCAPVWGADALRVLSSPYNGFEDRVHAAAAIYFREMFNFGLNGLVWTSNILAGVKFVIAAGFVAFLIEFARSLVTRTEVNRETTDVVLMLSTVGIAIWAVPAMALDDGGLARLYATQLLLIAGAIVVITVERLMEKAPDMSRVAAVQREREAERIIASDPDLAPLLARPMPSRKTQS